MLAVRCTHNKYRVRLFTVVRKPTDKFLSAAYFWKRHVPEALQAKLEADRPDQLETQDIDELATAIFKLGSDRFAAPGPLLQYSYVFGRISSKERDRPTEHDRQVACERIQSEFTVGVTEKMESFIVLVSLEMGWSLEEMCYYPSHVNKKRPLTARFRPEVLAHIEDKLAPDQMLYDCAARAHDTQSRAHKNFTASLELFQSSKFRTKCEVIKKTHDRANAIKIKERGRDALNEGCRIDRGEFLDSR